MISFRFVSFFSCLLRAKSHAQHVCCPDDLIGSWTFYSTSVILLLLASRAYFAYSRLHMSILLDVLWHQILMVACVTRFPLVGFLSRKSRVWKFDGTQIHAGRPKGQRMESVLALNAFNTHSLGLRDADSNDITFHSMALFKSILIFKYFYDYWVNFNSSVFSLLFLPKKTEWTLEVLPRLLRILGSPGQPGARRALFTLSCLELKPRLRAHGFANSKLR